MKILQGRVQFFHADRRTDIRTWWSW